MKKVTSLGPKTLLARCRAPFVPATHLSHSTLHLHRYYSSLATAQSPPSPSLFARIHHHWRSISAASPRDLKTTPIPSTGKWSQDEINFFRIFFYQVDSPEWETYLCKQAPLTSEARSIVQMRLSYIDMMEGNYRELPFLQRTFATILFSLVQRNRTEAVTDRLVMFLLDVCNPDVLLVPQTRIKQFRTKVGKSSFVSIPDASVGVRVYSVSEPYVGPALVVVEDKPKDVKDVKDVKDDNNSKEDATEPLTKEQIAEKAEFQLAGEMVSAAMSNYSRIKRPQTIFAMRVVGTDVTFYRADFPLIYLQSLKAGIPATNVAIIRVGGTTTTTGLSIAIDQEREIAIQWICNIMHTCGQIADSIRRAKVATITTERLTQIYPSKN